MNASNTKAMIVSRSRTMNPESPPLTIDGTVLKESDDLDILGVTFDSKLTIEKHLRSVSRAACQFWNTVLQCGVRLPIHTLNYLTT